MTYREAANLRLSNRVVLKNYPDKTFEIAKRDFRYSVGCPNRIGFTVQDVDDPEHTLDNVRHTDIKERVPF